MTFRNKQIFDKEHTRQKNCLFADFSLAAVVAWLGTGTALLFISLLAALQSATFPWIQLIRSTDEFLFVGAFLWVFLSLPSVARYLSWRALVASLKLLAARARRSVKISPAPIWLSLAQLFDEFRHQVSAYWRQLRQRMAQRPPNLWRTGRAPLKLFQQAALLLAP